eukprot:GFYU01006468.1.p1 GENE.GFYU01006468.1~~GFYU01006468.1.p1  ORF type:complete len:978 (+),score=227.75 GFYU01006468.1:88-3021(+)
MGAGKSVRRKKSRRNDSISISDVDGAKEQRSVQQLASEYGCSYDIAQAAFVAGDKDVNAARQLLARGSNKNLLQPPTPAGNVPMTFYPAATGLGTYSALQDEINLAMAISLSEQASPQVRPKSFNANDGASAAATAIAAAEALGGHQHEGTVAAPKGKGAVKSNGTHATPSAGAAGSDAIAGKTQEERDYELALKMSQETSDKAETTVAGESANVRDELAQLVGASTKEEGDVIWESSIINDRVFLPWTDHCLNDEEFFPKKPFEDPDGLMTLTAKQYDRLDGWQRPSQFIGSGAQIVMDKMSSKAINQSIVGDCSFLCGLASAAEYENRFGQRLITGNLYPQDEKGKPMYNPSGKYICSFEICGLRRKVVIDDQFPVDRHGTLLCSTSHNKRELWVSLLEKAYMKVRGGYGFFHGSDTGTDLHALCGWLPENIVLGEQGFDTEFQWSKLHAAFNAGDCLVNLATSAMENHTMVMDDHSPNYYSQSTGLVPNHAYAVLDMKEAFGHRLLQVKNPWSRQRWNGKFSDVDTASWTPELQQALQYDFSLQSHIDNGIFWIDWDSVVQNFRSASVSWNPKYFGHERRFHGKWIEDSTAGGSIENPLFGNNPQYILEINTPQHTVAWFLLSKHLTEWSESDWITLHIFKSEKGSNSSTVNRVYHPNKALYQGTYINSNNYLAQFDIPAGKHTFIVVPSQLYTRTLSFSLQIMMSVPFQAMSIPQESAPFYKKVRGEWSIDTAGGSCNCPTYETNPQHELIVHGNTKLLMKLYILDRSSAMNIRLMKKRDLLVGMTTVAHSGNYYPGFSFLEISVDPGVYVVVPSTFNPGEMKTYTLEVFSDRASFELSSIPLIEDMPFETNFTGVFDESNAMGSQQHGVYFKNPEILLNCEQTCQVLILMKMLDMDIPFPTNVSMYDLRTKSLLSSSGPYQVSTSGIRTQLVTITPSEYGYCIIPSTQDPMTFGTFEISVFSTSKITLTTGS